MAWDYYSYEQNGPGFQQAIEEAFAGNQIDPKTLRRVTLKVNGDRIMELYETPEVEAEAEASE